QPSVRLAYALSSLQRVFHRLWWPAGPWGTPLRSWLGFTAILSRARKQAVGVSGEQSTFSLFLRHQSPDYVPCNIRKPEIAPGMAEREARVVEAQQVQDCGVKIVDMDTILGPLGAHFIRRAVYNSRLRASSGDP